MRPVLFSLFFDALLILLFLVLIQRRQTFARLPLLALFFGIYFLDNLAITLTNHFPCLQIVPNHIWGGFLLYGWSGKLYSFLLAVGLLFLVRPRVTKEDVGITLRQNEGFLLTTFLVVLALAAWALIVGLNSPKGQPDSGC